MLACFEAMEATPLVNAVPERDRSAAGGGSLRKAPVAESVAENVRRIPVRVPLALPNAEFSLFVPEYLRPAATPVRNAEREVVAPAVAAPKPEPKAGVVRARTETIYYEVKGRSRSDIAAALRNGGPNIRGRQFFGMTEWEVSAGYRPVERANGCSIDALTVEVKITTHLPQWQKTSTASEELSGAWEQFLEALAHHEDGHRALAEEAAEAIRQRLLATTESTCAQLDLTAQREMTTVMGEYEARNLAYDAETGHGRTQGAVWPLD
jgi:predicted secreted Zn-dependent protease